jgi:hypothetical protein
MLALAFSSDELTDAAMTQIESAAAASDDEQDELPSATVIDAEATDLALDDWA